MIDDLVTLGTEEPYRMFTSRAEHRLLLGCDSVYERLSPIAHRLGILDDERRRRTESRAARLGNARSAAKECTITPDKETAEWLGEVGLSIGDRTAIAGLMQRPQFELGTFLEACRRSGRLESFVSAAALLTEEESEGLVNALRYSGYIARQQREAALMTENDFVKIPADLDFRLPGLSREMVEKLSSVRPASLGQASRIRGVTPAAISILRMHIRHHGSARCTVGVG